VRSDITLRSDDASRYEQYRERVAEQRDGVEPSRAELLRMMMDQFDPSDI
jgi:hypothetical protein